MKISEMKEIINNDITNSGISQFWCNNEFWTVSFNNDEKLYKATMRGCNGNITSKNLNSIIDYIINITIGRSQ